MACRPSCGNTYGSTLRISSPDSSLHPSTWDITQNGGGARKWWCCGNLGNLTTRSPETYRPISLLNTLGKLLEAVMARRLSHLAEKHGLLPDTQFGGRPGRTTEQALLVVSNAIDRAWYKHNVVTLVAFDLKGAFNGVNKVSLDARL